MRHRKAGRKLNRNSIEKAGGNVAEIIAPVKRPKGVKKTERDTE